MSAARGFFLVGVFLGVFRLAWPEENPTPLPQVAFDKAEKKEIIRIVDSPENSEEALRETALEESEHSFRARRFSLGKVILERSRVFNNNNSGMLTFAQLEMPLFQGRSPLHLSEIAQFEKKSYHALRNKMRGERWVQFQRDTYDAMAFQTVLSLQKEIGDTLSELLSRAEKLAVDQLKPKDEIIALRRETLLNSVTMANAKAKLEVLKNRLAYFSGAEDPNTFDVSAVKLEDDPLCPEDLISELREQVQKRDPDLQILRAEQEKQAAKVRWAESERFPELLAVVRQTHDPRFAEDPDQTFAGVRFEQELWGFGALSHKISREKYSLAAQNQQIKNEERLRLLRFDETVQLYRGSYALWKGQMSTLEFVRQIRDETFHRYNAGETSWKQFALANIDFLQQSKEVEIARFEVLKNKAELWGLFGTRDSNEGNP